jgi:hypothetical protein
MSATEQELPNEADKVDGADEADEADKVCKENDVEGTEMAQGLLAVQERKLTDEMTKDCPTSSLYGTLKYEPHQFYAAPDTNPTTFVRAFFSSNFFI